MSRSPSRAEPRRSPSHAGVRAEEVGDAPHLTICMCAGGDGGGMGLPYLCCVRREARPPPADGGMRSEVTDHTLHRYYAGARRRRHRLSLNK